MKTTLAKAKAVRPFAEKMITLGKRGDLHSRRVASASLRQKEAVRKLFAELAGAAHQRPAGGYCRIVKLGPQLTARNRPPAAHRLASISRTLGRIV
jgi:large subunit ribosomal protein L17